MIICRNLATQQLERSDRLKRLQENLNAKGLTDDEKQEKLREHASKETEFLRLRRSKLGADDFEPLKVIGKGAFGEVRYDSDFTIIQLFQLFSSQISSEDRHWSHLRHEGVEEEGYGGERSTGTCKGRERHPGGS